MTIIVYAGVCAYNTIFSLKTKGVGSCGEALFMFNWSYYHRLDVQLSNTNLGQATKDKQEMMD